MKDEESEVENYVLCTRWHKRVRILSLQTMNTIPCPDCGMDIDYEIGPDETLEAAEDTAVLVEKITGEEEVEKMDSLLSLAITGGDYNWI